MSWAIIGLGWLGSALQENLTQKQMESWGTHRSDLDLTISELPSRAHTLLFLNTPPLLNLTPRNFVEKIKPSGAQRIIFISSTSVFGENAGAVNEKAIPLPQTPNGLWLYETENRLKDFFKERLRIIRPAGLIGGERHPAKSLSGRIQVPQGLEPINLIHRDDLLSFITLESAPALIHAVAPHHPTRMEYYNEWCERLKLPKIEFLAEKKSERVVNTLYTDLIEWRVPKLDRL